MKDKDTFCVTVSSINGHDGAWPSIILTSTLNVECSELAPSVGEGMLDVWTKRIRFSPSCLALSGLRAFCYPAPGLRPIGLALGWYVTPLRGTMAAHFQNIKALGFASNCSPVSGVSE